MENVTLVDVYNELKHLNRKVDQLERLLIPEVEASAKDKQDLEAAIAEYKSGKTVRFNDIRKG